MPRKCIIKSCTNSERKKQQGLLENVTFHVFPSNIPRRDNWVVNIQASANQFEPIRKGVVICSDHFDKRSFVTKPNGTTVLSNTALPTLFCTEGQSFSELEMLSSDFDSNKENCAGNSPQSCDTTILSASGLKRRRQDSQNKEKVGINGDNLQQSCFTQILSESKRLKPDHQIQKNVQVDGGNLEDKSNEANLSESGHTPITWIWSLQPGCVQTNLLESANTHISQDTEPKSQNESTTSTHQFKHPRRIRYPGDISDVQSMSRRELEHSVMMCKKKLEGQSKMIVALKRKVKAKDRQLSTLRCLVKELKKKFSLSEHASQSIENSFADDILEQLKEGKKTRSYSDNVRSFALTLNFYSNAAYQYVRRKFGNHLPAVSTLREWYKNVDGEPGICADSLNILKRRVLNAQSKGKKVFLALMFDEMCVRRQVIWNHNLKKFIGYVDCGTENPDTDHSEEATDALVFLVNTVNESWKLPLAYFFTNKLTGDEKANILKQLLHEIHETGAEVMSLTFDGASNNITMSTALGVDFSNPDINKEYSFKNPATGKAIYIILDICHMMKLVRNILGTKYILYDKAEKEIKWNYIAELELLQRVNGLHLGTKLTQQHIKFHNSKMKVKLATQTLSNSVADALIYCLDRKYSQFKGCKETITYVSIFDQLFDTMNSRNLYRTGFKRPLQQSTYDEYVALFNRAERYIKELQMQQPVYRNKKIVGYVKKPILSTACKTGFLGFIVGMSSFKNMYKTYVLDTKQLKFLLGYKFSQDHVETLFSVIRSRGGFNNNPNCEQFKTAFKRLLMRNELQSSLNGNCLSDDTKIASRSHMELINSSTRTSDLIRKIQLESEDYDIGAVTELPDPLTEYAIDVVIHIAGYVERHIKKEIRCSECLKCLSTDNTMYMYGTLTRIKNQGGLTYPQSNIYKICKITEQEIRLANIKSKTFFAQLINRVLRSVLGSNIFGDINHSCKGLNNDHKTLLIKGVVDYYIKIRCFHLAKQANLASTQTFVRKKLTKLIHFKNQ